MVRGNLTKFYVMVLGNTLDSHKTFLDNLTISPKLREESTLKDSDVIIAFVPISSRAGTDISAAMGKIPEGKPVVLVVLHNTFDPDYVAPDSRRCVNNERVFAVDCLFHEDQGLLRCLRNDDAIRAVKKHLIPEVEHTSYMSNFFIVCFGCIVGVIIVGLAVGIPVGVFHGTAVGIGAGFVVAIIVIIPETFFLVKYHKAQKQQHLPQSSC